MADTVFVVDVKGWEHAFESNGGIVGDYIGEQARKTMVLASIGAPKATGNMVSTIRSKMEAPGSGGPSAVVTVGTKYSLFVHEGTKPHPIFPKKKGGRLVFFWPKVGHVVSFKSVHHPGTRAQPFLMDALRRVIG